MMNDLWLTYGLPFILGILVSIVIWLIFTYIIVPRVKISPKISKTKGKVNSKYKYKVKLCDTSWRTIIDLEFFARLHVKGLDAEYPNNYQVDYIPVRDKRIPWLKPKNTKKTHGIIITLLDGDFEEYKLPLYPDSIQNAIKNGSLQLEDLLSLNEDSSLQFIVFGFDRISGTRKMFQREYRIQDIIKGKFEKKSLRIIPET